MDERFTIVRGGKKDLSFTGEKLAEVSGKRVDGQSRWEEVRLYKTKEKYVLETEYISQWQGEVCYTKVDVFSSPLEVLAAVLNPHSGISDMDKALLQEAAKKDRWFVNTWVEEL